MCPACIAILALAAAGATSTGGLAALVAKQRRADRVLETAPGQTRGENEP
ncbi:MAG: hypothetical protein HY700_18870 [Gemmatimonadetes bacterium]|nr:hypothetical protein [Gemmatimonadota bacterium]